MTKVLPFLILISAGFLARNPDHWHSQIMIGELGVLLWLAFEICKRVHPIAGMAFGAFASTTCYLQYSQFTFAVGETSLQLLFDQTTARSLVFLVLVTLPFIFSGKRGLLWWLQGFRAFAAVNAVVMIYNYFAIGTALGLIGMDSVDGTFLAVLFPLTSNIYFAVLCSAALLLAKSSTVYGVILLEILVYLMFFSKRNFKTLIWFTSALALTIPLGYLYLGKQLFETNGRLHILQSSFEVFSQYGSYLQGIGTGSFLVLMPLLQPRNYPGFAWLHNEPAQVLFEQGLWGLLALGVLYGAMLWKTRKNAPWFLVVCAAGFQSFFQPSFRYFIFALLLAFIARTSFDDEFINAVIYMKGKFNEKYFFNWAAVAFNRFFGRHLANLPGWNRG